MTTTAWVIVGIIGIGWWFSVGSGRLTQMAGITGAVLGWVIYKGAGSSAFAAMTAFFLLGTLATSWKMKHKQNLGLAETNKGRRKASQVVANAGVSALAGAWAWIYPAHMAAAALVVASAFAAAAADTVSSELGNVYGRRFVNISNFRKDERGLNGVVSLEGTLLGLLASILIASIYALGWGWHKAVWIVVVAGTAGNIADSLLGATLERKRYVNNDVVNFLNTLVAALLAIALGNR